MGDIERAANCSVSRSSPVAMVSLVVPSRGSPDCADGADVGFVSGEMLVRRKGWPCKSKELREAVAEES